MKAIAMIAIALGLLGITAVAGSAAPNPRETPRAAVAGFLTAADARDWAVASGYLDLRRVPAADRAARGAELARELHAVLERTTAIDPDTISDQPEGDRSDGLPANQERVGSVETKGGPVGVLLQRGSGPDDGWRIAPTTVARIPALYGELGGIAFEGRLPDALVRIRVLDVALWQWLALMIVLVVAWVSSWLVALGAVRVTCSVVSHAKSQLGRDLLRATIGPARLGLGVVAFAGGVAVLGLPFAARQTLGVLERAGAIIAIAWVLVRFIDVLAHLLMETLTAHGRVTATGIVPIGGRTAKVVVAGFAVIAILQNAGLNVTGVLAGLGIGGLAVALAAQKTVENLFGGVSLVVDQPLRVGDFCRFGDQVGTVEEVGLRSTRIRTLDRTVISVPNAQFASLSLENFSARERMWFHPTIRLRYETTPDELRHVLLEVGRMLRAHPRVDPNPARIRFVGFGAYSLDLEIFAYVRTADFDEFLTIQEDLNLRIMGIVAASGTGFAFPSQTTYLASDQGIDATRHGAAEAQVHEHVR